MRNLKFAIRKSVFISLLTTSYMLLATCYPVSAQIPASTHYQMINYGFGAGSTASSSSTDYSLNGVAGEVDSASQSSANYTVHGGLNGTQAANVPPAPTFTNPGGNSYNKLNIVVNKDTNDKSDYEYAVAVSSDNFTTTEYVQMDGTLGSTIFFQGYTAWYNSGLGTNIIGLLVNTTYTAKVAARQNYFTQSQFGPTASVATVNPSFTLSISPSTINFNTLAAGSITNSPSNVTVDVDTNAASGAYIYIYGLNAGLKSAKASNYLIASLTGDLNGQNEGFGAQNVSTFATNGTLAVAPPYDGSSENIGIIDTTYRTLYTTGAPITGGVGVFMLKAKASATTPPADDYSETLTVIGSANF